VVHDHVDVVRPPSKKLALQAFEDAEVDGQGAGGVGDDLEEGDGFGKELPKQWPADTRAECGVPEDG
jgi:hypothetical protein